MTAAPCNRSARSALGHTIIRATAVAGLLLLGACSIPDWADPGSYFEPSYGPAPQPVARAGTDPLPASRPAPGLASASNDARRSGEKPVIAVTESSATTPSAATPRLATPAPATSEPRQVAQAAAVPPPQPAAAAAAPAPAPRASARRATPTPARPVVQRSAASDLDGRAPVPAATTPRPVPEPVSREVEIARAPRASARKGESPTPMIAAMTQGQTPPSFSADGRVVPRRTDVAASSDLSLDSNRTAAPAVRPAAPASTEGTARPAQPAVAPTRIATASPAPSRTFEQATAGVSAGPVQPGQFPSSVSPVVQQTYQEYLQAPRTYDEVVGRSPDASGGSVVISGGGVQAAPVLTGAAGGADAVIQFRHGSTALSSGDMAIIRRIAGQARQTNARVRVRGHSSSRTGQMPVERHLLANLRISARRAETVADALAQFGVPYDRIIVEAKGDNNPVYNEAMPSGEAGNRRAEIYLEN